MLQKQDLEFIRRLYDKREKRKSFLSRFDLHYREFQRRGEKGGRPRQRQAVPRLTSAWSFCGRQPRENDVRTLIDEWERLLAEMRDSPGSELIACEQLHGPGIPAALLPVPVHQTRAGRTRPGFPPPEQPPAEAGGPVCQLPAGVVELGPQPILDGFVRMMQLKQELHADGRSPTDAEAAAKRAELEELELQQHAAAIPVVPSARAFTPATFQEMLKALNSAEEVVLCVGPPRLQGGADPTDPPPATPDPSPQARVFDATDRNPADYLGHYGRLLAAGKHERARALTGEWIEDVFTRRIVADPSVPCVRCDLLRIVERVRASGTAFRTARCRSRVCGALQPWEPDDVQAWCSPACERANRRAKKADPEITVD